MKKRIAKYLVRFRVIGTEQQFSTGDYFQTLEEAKANATEEQNSTKSKIHKYFVRDLETYTDYELD